MPGSPMDLHNHLCTPFLEPLARTYAKSRQSLLEACAAKDALDRQLKASAARNEQLSVEFDNKEKEFQVRREA